MSLSAMASLIQDFSSRSGGRSATQVSLPIKRLQHRMTELDMDLTVSLISDYSRGAARSAIDAVAAQTVTGQTDAQWWQKYEKAFESVFDASRFPLAAKVGTAVGQAYNAAHDPQRSFEFGLGRLLDGIEAYIRTVNPCRHIYQDFPS